MTRLEQETIINFNEAEATATIYTHNAGGGCIQCSCQLFQAPLLCFIFSGAII